MLVDMNENVIESQARFFELVEKIRSCDKPEEEDVGTAKSYPCNRKRLSANILTRDVIEGKYTNERRRTETR